MAAVLHRPPHVVTYSDPEGAWQRFYRRSRVSRAILEELDAVHRRVASGRPIPTFEGTAGFVGAGKIDTWSQPKHWRRFVVEDDFILCAKNPEIFLEYLDVFLDGGVKTIVCVRHPVAIIDSWVHRDPRRPAGLANGSSLVFEPSSTTPSDRRIDLYNYLASRAVRRLGHENMLVIKHEDWYTDPSTIDRVCAFLDLPRPNVLSPPPLAPAGLQLSQTEQGRILEGCTIAAEFGYDLDADGRLAAPTSCRC